jgi:hypothetical protein
MMLVSGAERRLKIWMYYDCILLYYVPTYRGFCDFFEILRMKCKKKKLWNQILICKILFIKFLKFMGF